MDDRRVAYCVLRVAYCVLRRSPLDAYRSASALCRPSSIVRLRRAIFILGSEPAGL